MSDTDEPWSSYRKLNAGLQKLTAMLEEIPRYEQSDTGRQVLDAVLPLSQDLEEKAKTVETAAMVRALEFVRDGIHRTALEETQKGYLPTEVMAKLTHRMQGLIDDCARS